MRSLIALVISVTFIGAAVGQDYPDKMIRLVVPYPAGGATDILARAIQQPMSDVLGKSVIIDNKAGAGGIIGTREVARSAPDGYTIDFGNLGPNAINVSLYQNLGYDPIKDFSPVSLVAMMPLFLVANPNVPATNVAELIALAKSKPGEIGFASVGVGSASHVTGELFNTMAGVKLTHIPYKGGAPAVNDVIAGHVPLMFATGLEATNHIKNGRMKLLGVTPKRRSMLFPDAPSIGEVVPGFDVSVWFGVLAPARTPVEVVKKLNDSIRRAVALPEVQARLTELNTEPISTTPEEFAGIIAADVAKWAKVIKAAGIQLN